MPSLQFICFFVLMSITSGCFNLGGGGGGCGGGCGCGRRKRSIDAPPPFTNLDATDKDMLCNSPELRQIMITNMKDTATESGKALSAVLEQHGDRFVVVCAEHNFEYFVRHDTEFCGIRNGTHYCQAFAI